MGFDKDAFLSTNWQPIEAEMHVPELSDWFKNGSKPVWKVRTLEGLEVAKARHAKERNLRLKNNIDAIAEVLHSKNDATIKKNFEVIIETFNADAETAYRHELLILATVEPKNVDYHVASVIHKVRPETYYRITNKIVELIGKGFDAGKLPASGMTQQSKTP